MKPPCSSFESQLDSSLLVWDCQVVTVAVLSIIQLPLQRGPHLVLQPSCSGLEMLCERWGSLLALGRSRTTWRRDSPERQLHLWLIKLPETMKTASVLQKSTSQRVEGHSAGIQGPADHISLVCSLSLPRVSLIMRVSGNASQCLEG